MSATSDPRVEYRIQQVDEEVHQYERNANHCNETLHRHDLSSLECLDGTVLGLRRYMATVQPAPYKIRLRHPTG